MKLTQKIREEILVNYCKAKYHAELKKRGEAFTKEVENAVKEHFETFDFEKAKEFKEFIFYYDYVNIIGFYNEKHQIPKLAEKLFFSGIPFSNGRCLSIQFLYPGKNSLYFDETKKGKALIKSFFHEMISTLEKLIEEKEIINAVLLSCNTDKQLTETLPEIMQYYPKNTGTATQLISVETLNKAKGLLQAV